MRRRAGYSIGLSSARAVAAALGGALVIGLLATAAAQQAPTFTTVPAANVNQAQKALAQKVAHATLGAWKAGRPADLSGFTQQMKTALPPAKQAQAWTQITAMFGDYQSLAFHEAATSPQMPGIIVYRFRGNFAKSRPEVRVVLDASSKVAGLWVRPWNDVLM